MGFIGKICEFNNDVSFACGRLPLTEGNPVAEVGYEAKEKKGVKGVADLGANVHSDCHIRYVRTG